MLVWIWQRSVNHRFEAQEGHVMRALVIVAEAAYLYRILMLNENIFLSLSVELMRSRLLFLHGYIFFQRLDSSNDSADSYVLFFPFILASPWNIFAVFFNFFLVLRAWK